MAHNVKRLQVGRTDRIGPLAALNTSEAIAAWARQAESHTLGNSWVYLLDEFRLPARNNNFLRKSSAKFMEMEIRSPRWHPRSTTELSRLSPFKHYRCHSCGGGVKKSVEDFGDPSDAQTATRIEGVSPNKQADCPTQVRLEQIEQEEGT
jgi:hypothetical protein